MLYERFKDVSQRKSNAPFTISLLETLPGGGFLLPGEWIRIVQSVLSQGQFLTWKADFVDRCQTLTAANQKNPNSPTAGRSVDKLCGQGRYAKESIQQRLPMGLLTQTATAALAAWRSIPTQRSVTSPLTKVIQGGQETYSEFVGLLLETAKRLRNGYLARKALIPNSSNN